MAVAVNELTQIQLELETFVSVMMISDVCLFINIPCYISVLTAIDIAWR